MGSNYVEGYHGKVLVGTTDLNIQGWSGKIETNEVDISTTGDGGWDDSAGTRKKFTFQFEGVWKKSANPYSNAPASGDIPAGPNMFPGNTIDVLKLYTDEDELIQGKALILSVDHKVESADVHRFTVSGRNKGPFTGFPGYTPPGEEEE